MDPSVLYRTLERARAGDARALGELLESFRPYVRAVVRPFRDERLQAKIGESDLVQDALLEAHVSFAGFRGTTVAELVAWLRQVAVRTAGTTRRGFVGTDKRDPARELPNADLAAVQADSTSPSAAAVHNEETARITAALAGLPEDMQRVLLARHADGLAHAEIARQLGRTEGAVRVLYVRALDRLRELCAELQ